MKEAILTGELMQFLETIKDHGTSIDTGSGMGEANLWVIVDGIEWFVTLRKSITLRKSNNQIAKETGQ